MYDPGAAAGRRDRSGHHLRADTARHAGRRDRQAPLAAQHSVPERADPRPRRVRAARQHHRRRQDGGPGLAHAGRAALGRALHLAAFERHRRREGGDLRHRRLRAHPPPVQHAGGQVRGRRAGDRAHGRAHLHHGCGAQRHDRGHRCGRAAGGARRHPQVPRHRDGPARRQRRHGRAWRQGHHAGAAQLPGPRLPVGAHRDHRRGREHPDAQPDHLRPGRDPLPSRTCCAR